LIYFIQDPEDSLVKIGTTVRLSFRLAQLKSQFGQGLVVLGILDGSFADEKVLHEQFAGAREDGEWFRPYPHLMGFIAQECRPWTEADDAPLPTGFKTISARCSSEWADWLERGAKYCRTDVAKLIDTAVVKYLRAEGFDDPPPERVP
jgi:hypothetical protein